MGPQVLLVAAVALVIAGCGGGGGNGQGGGGGAGAPPSAPPSPALTVNLTADDAAVSTGGSTALRWTSTAAATVASSNFGATSVSGAKWVTPAGTTVYSITVTGRGTSASDTVRVRVDGSIPPGKIAFSTDVDDGNEEIYRMKTDGGSWVCLTHHPAHDTSPAWSPDGTEIAFVSRFGRPSGIYKMNADGTGQTRLTPSSLANPGHPAWSRDGTKIAFDNSIFVLSSDGTGISPLTACAPGSDMQPSSGPSPPGTHDSSIYVMKSDGTGISLLTPSGPGSDMQPTWSADGTQIAFHHQENGRSNVYVMNSDGSGRAPLTATGGKSPAWSPDGTSIAFVREVGEQGEVYLMNTNGTGQTRLTDGGGEGPAWSPNGKKILFVRWCDGNWRIYVMNSDGSGQTRLTNAPDSSDTDPAWSLN